VTIITFGIDDALSRYREQMGNILVVDDNEDMCQVISDVLRSEGYMVRIANDGKSALNELKTEACDLLILDYKLFDMSGLDVLKETREIAPALCTIMISAYGNELVKARAFELGAYDFFDKPFDVNVLLKTVRKALSAGRGQGASSVEHVNAIR